MKRKLFSVMTLICTSIAVGQTIHLPLSKGGEYEGGTILKIDATNGAFEATPMTGKIATIEEDISFNNNVPTSHSGIFYESSNNSLYIVAKNGSREIGDTSGQGSIFRYDIVTKKTHLIKQFSENSKDGDSPFGELQKIGSKLYGVTKLGGVYGYGVIYMIDTTNDSYTVLHSFNGTTEGGYPSCQLFAEGTMLYGAGIHGNGVAGTNYFSYNTSNATFSSLYVGGGSNIKGLFKSGNRLYIAKGDDIVDLDLSNPSAGITVFYLGAGLNTPLGYSPYQFTRRSGDVSWYTIFKDGGLNNNYGSIAKLNLGDKTVTAVHHFQGTTLGQDPSTKLTDGLNGAIYGTAFLGSGNDYCLYQMSAIGVYNILHKFNVASDGTEITAAPVLVGGKLYGISERYGQYGGGSIWSYDFNNSNFVVEAQLGYDKGSVPVNGLTMNPTTNKLNFVCNQFGANHKGTINSLDATNNYSTIINLNDVNIKEVLYKPFYFNNKTFIIAQLSNGTIATYNSLNGLCEIDSSGNIVGQIIPIEPVADLSNLINTRVQGNVIQDGSKIYGASINSLWSVDLSTKTFSSLFTFNSAVDGNSPTTLTMSEGKLYGINEKNGANNKGTVFSFNTIGNQFSILETIPANKIYNGSAVNNNKLYSIITTTTTNNNVLASIDLTSPTSFIQVATIDSGLNGSNPICLGSYNDAVYGLMNEGGANNIGGVFKFNVTSSTLSQLLDFTKLTGNRSFKGEFYFTPETLSINDFETKQSVSIYPNPSNDKFFINDNSVTELRVYNILGTLLFTKKDTNTFDLTNFPSGVYIVKINSSTKGNIVNKVVKN